MLFICDLYYMFNHIISYFYIKIYFIKRTSGFIYNQFFVLLSYIMYILNCTIYEHFNKGEHY